MNAVARRHEVRHGVKHARVGLQLGRRSCRVTPYGLDPLGAPVDRLQDADAGGPADGLALRRGDPRPVLHDQLARAVWRSHGRACESARQKGGRGRQEAKLDPPEHVTPGEIRYYKPHRML